ncbi:MAG: glycosyltransferase family 4 protein, partial [Planctomycetota bacterium]
SDPGARPRQIARWIRHAGVPTVIFIAHGEGSYTQSRLTQMHAVCDHVVCVSDHVRQRLTIQTPCTVIPNGVDTRTCVATKPSRETRSQLGFDDDDFVVGFVGRFSDEKNPGAVIDSLQHLPPNMKALMVGYGDEDLLQLRADQIGVADRVRWIDGQHFRPIGEAYAAMDALVMPSREEGFGLVALEAMFAGVPVIATRRGVAADWIEQGQNGWLIDDDGTSETVAIEISKRITHLQQRPKRKLRMISKARKTADEMGHASTMMRKYEALLQSCVAAHASFYP